MATLANSGPYVGQDEAKSQAPVAEAIDMLNFQINNLEAAVNEIAAKLSPVLTEAEDSDGDKESADQVWSGNSQYVVALHSLRRRIKRTVDQINYLKYAVEV